MYIRVADDVTLQPAKETSPVTEYPEYQHDMEILVKCQIWINNDDLGDEFVSEERLGFSDKMDVVLVNKIVMGIEYYLF